MPGWRREGAAFYKPQGGFRLRLHTPGHLPTRSIEKRRFMVDKEKLLGGGDPGLVCNLRAPEETGFFISGKSPSKLAPVTLRSTALGKQRSPKMTMHYQGDRAT